MGNAAVNAALRIEGVDTYVPETKVDGNSWKSQQETKMPDKTEFPEQIEICGAKGSYSKYINGTFVATGKMYNKRMLYRSLSKPTYWLRFTKGLLWMVSSTQDRRENAQGGICRCIERDLISPCHARSWFVLSRKKGVFRSQKLVKVAKRNQNNVSETQQLDNDAIGQAEQRTFDVVKIEGATGIVAEKINGFYQYSDTRSYTKTTCQLDSETEAESIKLLYDSETGRWIIGQTLGGKDTLVLAYCASPDITDPCNVSRWFVCNAASVFLVHPCMVVTRCAELTSLNASGSQNSRSPENSFNGDTLSPDSSPNPVGKKIRPAPLNRSLSDEYPQLSFVYSHEYI